MADDAVATALNDSDEDVACLEALHTAQALDPAFILPASFYDSDEDATCLEALHTADRTSILSTSFYDSDGDAACLEALEAAEATELEAEPLPLEFELIPHVDRRVRKFGLHRRVYATRLVQRGGALSLDSIPRDQLPALIDQALQLAVQRQVLNQPDVHPNDHLMINLSSR